VAVVVLLGAVLTQTDIISKLLTARVRGKYITTGDELDILKSWILFLIQTLQLAQFTLMNV
jgi:hypothetical protein